MSTVYCIRNKEYVQKILSENRVSSDMVDHTSRQTFEQFKSFQKPTIYYDVNDFLICISKDAEKDFEKNKFFDLYRADAFGWYYDKAHKSEIQIFQATSPQKYDNITSQNPDLIVSSFDRFREFYRSAKLTNLLNGAFGLSYSCFRDRFDNLFRKINIDKDQWIIKRSELDNQDKPILVLLFLYHNSETNMLNETIFKDEDQKAFRMYGKLLEKAMHYFLANDYTMDDFLEKISAELDQDDDLRSFSDGFKKLNNEYVKKGLNFDPKDPFTKVAKEFIDLAKTETDKLHNLKQSEDLNPTAVFLVGMLQLGDRIDELLSLDHFVFAFVELTMKHIVDIKVSETEIYISFDQNEVNKNRNNRYTYIEKYFKELHQLHSVTKEINELSKKHEKFQTIFNYRSNIIALDGDLNDLTDEEKRLVSEKKDLSQKVSKEKTERDGAQKMLEGLEDNLSDIEKSIEKIDNELKKMAKRKKTEELRLKKEKEESSSSASKKKENKKEDNIAPNTPKNGKKENKTNLSESKDAMKAGVDKQNNVDLSDNDSKEK